MEVKELLKLSILNNQIPRYLYRYRELDDNFNGIIEQNSMWFSSPVNFNDPFDCKVNLENDYNENQIKEFLINHQNYTEFKTDLVINHLEKEGFIEILNRTIIENIKSKYICCFAKSKEDLLMWSHYSKGHTGVCLKFDLLEDLDFFTFIQKVNYSNDYPKIDYLKDSKNALSKILGTKSKHWEYEQEYRVIKIHANNNRFQFNKKSLIEITFGCNTQKDKIISIIELAKSSGYGHLKFSKAITDSTDFKLNFEQINNIINL